MGDPLIYWFEDWPGTRPLPHPRRWFGIWTVFERRIRSSTPGLQVLAISLRIGTLFGCGPDCDVGFCLGTRLGEGRGRVFTAISGCLTLPEISGQALAGSNKSRRSREGYSRAGSPDEGRRPSPSELGGPQPDRAALRKEKQLTPTGYVVKIVAHITGGNECAMS
jgi:hypothetical protein